MRPLIDIIRNLFDDYDGHRHGLALMLCKLLGNMAVRTFWMVRSSMNQYDLHANIGTTGLFFEDGTSFWIDIFSLAKQPITLLSMPIEFELPMRKAYFPFPEPTSIDIPRVSNLSPVNIFNDESSCLMNRVIKHGSGAPVRCIFLKKKEVVTGPNGWKCVYDGAFRPFLIPGMPPRCSERGQASNTQRLNTGKTHKPTELYAGSDSSSSDCSYISESEDDIEPTDQTDDEDMRSDDLSFWFKEDAVHLPRASAHASTLPNQVSIIDRPRILSEQHDYISNTLSVDINQEKYSLLVNTLDAIVTVRWKQSEQDTELWPKFTSAKLKSAAKGGKKLAASCSSSLTRYTVEDIRKRIHRWCAWHSA